MAPSVVFSGTEGAILVHTLFILTNIRSRCTILARSLFYYLSRMPMADEAESAPSSR